MDYKVDNNIRKFRKNMGLDIYTFSNRIGLSFSYISALENGIKINPSYKTIIKLMKIFNCTFEELFPQG